MDKTEALNKINVLIDQVIHAGPFKGRAYLLNTLDKLRDLIVLYKHSTNIYDIIVIEAEKLVKTIQEELDDEAKGD